MSSSMKRAIRRCMAVLLVMPIICGTMYTNALGLTSTGDQDGYTVVEQLEERDDRDSGPVEDTELPGPRQDGTAAGTAVRDDTIPDTDLPDTDDAGPDLLDVDDPDPDTVDGDDDADTDTPDEEESTDPGTPDEGAEGPGGQDEDGAKPDGDNDGEDDPANEEEEPEEEEQPNQEEEAGMVGATALTDAQSGGIAVKDFKLLDSKGNEIADGATLPAYSWITFLIKWDLPQTLDGSMYEAGQVFTIDLPSTGLLFKESALIELWDTVIENNLLGHWQVKGGQIIFTLAKDVYLLKNGEFRFDARIETTKNELQIEIDGKIITVNISGDDSEKGWGTHVVDYDPFLKFGTAKGANIRWYLHYNYDIAYDLATVEGAVEANKQRLSNVYIIDRLGEGQEFIHGNENLYFYFTLPTKDGTPSSEYAGEHALYMEYFEWSAGMDEDRFLAKLKENAPAYGYNADKTVAYIYYGNILENGHKFVKDSHLLSVAVQLFGLKKEVAQVLVDTWGHTNLIQGRVPAYSMALDVKVTDGGDREYTNTATVYYGGDGSLEDDHEVMVDKLSGHATEVSPDEARLIKRDADSAEPIQGVKFQLEMKSGGNWIPKGGYLTTDAGGEIRVDGLWDGEYRFVEVEAAPGYEAGSIAWSVESNGGVFTIDLDAKTGPTLNATNRKTGEPGGPTGDVRLRKVDADNSSITLAGAIFQLYMADGAAVGGPRTTPENGILTWSGLKLGRYYLVEVSAPGGYREPNGEKIYFEIKEKAGESSAVIPEIELVLDIEGYLVNGAIQVTNAREPEILGKVQVRKVDADNSATTLAGAAFQLYQVNGPTETAIGSAKTTGSDGQAAWDNLSEGSYRLVEQAAPNGYLLPGGSDASIAFELRREGEALALYIGNVKQDGLTIERKNTKTDDPTGDVQVRKVDADNSATTLSGAVFQLYRREGAGETPVGTPKPTGTGGIATWDGLPEGSYRLVEQAAPNGYLLPGGSDASIAFELRREGEALALYIGNAKQDGLTIERKNTKADDPTGDVHVRKVDADNSATTLSGAVFQLYRREGAGETPVGTPKPTGTGGIATWDGLPEGSYRLVEQAAPNGYLLPGGSDASIAFELRREGEALALYIGNVKQDGFTIERKNTKTDDPTGQVRLRKVDSADSSTLAGASFQLYRADGVAVGGERTTSAAGEIVWTGLAMGRYYLVETRAPAGYQPPGGERIYFELREDNGNVALTLDNNGYLVNGAIQVANTRNGEILGEVSVRKADSANTATNLSGAVFQLYKLENGSYTAFGMPVTTGADGRAWWTLTAGGYRLVEQRAPAGYTLPTGSAAQIDFELRESGNALVLYVNGVRQTGLTITRTNVRTPTTPPPTTTIPDGDVPLDGLITIEDGDVPLADLPTGLITIEDGPVPLGGLPFTGGFPIEAVLGLGMCLLGGGAAYKICRRYRVKKEDNTDS